MHRKELNERSPLRVLEQSIHGGLGRGNVGVVVARKGVGKTAFLVGVALDDLMRDRKVLHVSLDQSVDKVRSFYDEVFQDLAQERNLEDVWKVRLDMERNRQIYAYEGVRFSLDKLHKSIRFMQKHGDFVPAAIIIDGFDFRSAEPADIDRLREIGRECKAEVWMSAVTHRDADRNERGVPEPVAHLESAFDVILTMGHDGTAVLVGVHKDHDNPEVTDLRLALDPTTLLLVKQPAPPS